jgi:hypothetical protein
VVQMLSIFEYGYLNVARFAQRLVDKMHDGIVVYFVSLFSGRTTFLAR